MARLLFMAAAKLFFSDTDTISMLQNETIGLTRQGNSIASAQGAEHHSIQKLSPEFLIERMVHKLRNPLSVITTAASQLEAGVNEKLTDEDLYFFNAIQHGAEKLNDILTRLAFYGSSEWGDMEEIDPVELLRAAIKITEEKQPEKKDLVTIDFQDPGVTPLIICSPEQSKIMFEEILLNAYESIAGAGSVSISFTVNGNNLSITITDTGEGVNPDIIDRVFLPFVTDKPGYTGMGLTLADKIAELNGAVLEIVPGQTGGTVVTVTFTCHDD